MIQGATVDGGAASSRASFQAFNGLRRGFSLSSSQGEGQVIVVGRTRGVRQQQASSLRHTSVVATSVAAEEGTVPVLNDLPLLQYINQNGRIQPPVDNSTKASVFGIFDKNKKIQYIGFSKDVRNSLRTLMGRRPEMCYYYKIFNLNSLDQKTMLKCRQQVRLQDSNSKFSFGNLSPWPVESGIIYVCVALVSWSLLSAGSVSWSTSIRTCLRVYI